MNNSRFNKFPAVAVSGFTCYSGWAAISAEIRTALMAIEKDKKIIAVEIYPGAFQDDICSNLQMHFHVDYVFSVHEIYKDEAAIREMAQSDLGDDPVFGRLSYLSIDDYFDTRRLNRLHKKISGLGSGTILLIGTGAVCITEPDLLIYADMTRWEIQQRQRKNEISNLGVQNKRDKPSLKYKWAFFIDWRVCDRLKRKQMDSWDYVLDTNDRHSVKMVSGEGIREGLRKTARQPFELKPFFDPGPWGGQWLKEVCNLDRQVENYAWCFNCVPEENSLLFNFNGTLLEIPAINLVFYQSKALLGEAVFARFGAEFPIRFDFLDTMDGGNLSLQVHPLTDYIQNTFGWHYTQDESYYLMDAKSAAVVYLGLREGIDKEQMIRDLESAGGQGKMFKADNYVKSWPVKKHDHLLIPAGTVHCSGKNAMVLEISSTPYIFTFKLWDWGRMGLDGEPRPVHINHGKNVIQFDRVAAWTRKNLINQIKKIGAGDGWREEQTGLHQLEFIETRRHWFSKKTDHDTMGTVNVLNLVEGDEVIVESPQHRFEPLVVHYAETFVIPASVGAYTIRPHGHSAGKECATIKAYVRSG
jgi:mannose-6-phosphate isomerase class I